MHRLTEVHAPMRTLIGLLALVLATAFAYLPGLDSGFRFDDFSNLALLGRYGTVEDWDSFWLYITSGFAGPTGRPVAMLSFLLDANDWPADPWPFMRTSLLIHLFNGLLVFGIARCVLRFIENPQPSLTALLAAGLWLLHPFWVSTTLYAVQRMTLLSAFFVLLGVWGWLQLRHRKPPELSKTWLIGAPLLLGTAGLLAVLSKENGALLPAYIAALEVTVLACSDRLRGTTPTDGFRYWRGVLVGFPVACLAAYLAYRLSDFYIDPPSNAATTPIERLLTQTRILWEYTFHLLVPTSTPGGLYHDGITPSSGLLSPWTTLPASAGAIAAGIGAWVYRQRYPLVAMAILFFLVGHALESTVIRLELYFEHRNYLPAALMFVPLAAWWTRQTWTPRDVAKAVPLVGLAVLALMTGIRAQLWSTPFQQALQWIENRPHSARVHNHLANYWQDTGHIEEAERLVDKAMRLDPNGLPGRLKSVSYACRRAGEVEGAVADVERVLARTTYIGSVARYQLEKFLDYVQSGDCSAFTDTEAVLDLLQRLRDAGPSQGSYQRLLRAREARVHLQTDQIDQAYKDFSVVIRSSSEPRTQLGIAARMASAGYHGCALRVLDMAPPRTRGQADMGMEWLRHWYLETTDHYTEERRRLRDTISANLSSDEPGDCGGGERG